MTHTKTDILNPEKFSIAPFIKISKCIILFEFTILAKGGRG
jgi:hypothetical protein